MVGEQVYFQWRRIGLFEPSLILLLCIVGLILAFMGVIIYNYLFEQDPRYRQFFYLMSIIVIIPLVVALIILKDIVKLNINNQYIVIPQPPIEINNIILAVLAISGHRYVKRKVNLFHSFFNIHYIYIIPSFAIHIVISDWRVTSTTIELGPDIEENSADISKLKGLIDADLPASQ